MAQSKIYLRKVRDFGENMSDTFVFLRQEFKPLFISFLLISGAFTLSAAILSGFYQTEVLSIFEDLGKAPGQPDDVAAIFGSVFTGTYFVVMLLAVLGMVAMNVVVACYMKLYDQTEASPGVEAVWNEFKKHFFGAFILSIICWLAIMIGLVLCLLPGIYLMVALVPAIYIMVIEDASIGGAFNKCFTIIRENFWLSFAIYLVAYIIYLFAAGIIGFIVGIFTGVGSYLSTGQVDTTMGMVSAIVNVFSYLFYVVFAVSVGLHYFSLTERTDGAGIMRRLETLGSGNAAPTTDEQY